MLRGGRFDTQIYVGVPDQKAREFMVNRAMKNLPLDPDVDLQKLANALDGFGGGDIVAICDKIRLEAYKRSIRQNSVQNITREDCNAILKGIRNHITAEEMAKFIAYRNGSEVK
jgi:transitional endoplasmic reticulum ATPase